MPLGGLFSQERAGAACRIVPGVAWVVTLDHRRDVTNPRPPAPRERCSTGRAGRGPRQTLDRERRSPSTGRRGLGRRLAAAVVVAEDAGAGARSGCSLIGRTPDV